MLSLHVRGVIRTLTSALAFVAVASLLAPCAASAQAPTIGSAQTSPAKRIVALVPSMAEELFAVGAGDRVVGVSTYSDFPAEAKRLPVVASFASVNVERIVALHPDLVLGIVSQAAMTRDLQRAGLNVHLLRDDTLEDVYANLLTVGALTGRTDAARTLVRQLRARTAELTRTIPRTANAPSLFVVLGTAPIFTVGNGSYIARLIALAGARNAASDIAVPYARYSAETLLARQPDALVIDPEIHFDDVVGQAPWTALQAVQNHRVFTLPDAAILERPGPRYNEGLAWLIGVVRRIAH
ncbi:MAG: ABC transporter substrate-binding protein [Candidatus Eremiobacteraeota bacterium]|nr:ABC transporter substrate-binding protein [Candidatus Eremiobacteraeota bacterium]